MNTATRPVLSTTVSRRVDVSRPPVVTAPKKPQGKKSSRQLEQHEASLVPHIRSKTPVHLVMIYGERIENVNVVGFDRYSIAIEYDGFRETVFKSAIARIISTVEV